jgi:exodeoxyribonuclease VII large subunit
MRHDFTRRGRAMDRLGHRFVNCSPAVRLQRASQRVIEQNRRLRRTMTVAIERVESRLRLAQRALHSVSPLATLERGFAVVSDAASGRLLTDAASVAPGSTVIARLARGKLHATVTGTDDDNNDSSDEQRGGSQARAR